MPKISNMGPLGSPTIVGIQFLPSQKIQKGDILFYSSPNLLVHPQISMIKALVIKASQLFEGRFSCARKWPNLLIGQLATFVAFHVNCDSVFTT